MGSGIQYQIFCPVCGGKMGRFRRLDGNSMDCRSCGFVFEITINGDDITLGIFRNKNALYGVPVIKYCPLCGESKIDKGMRMHAKDDGEEILICLTCKRELLPEYLD